MIPVSAADNASRTDPPTTQAVDESSGRGPRNRCRDACSAEQFTGVS